MSKKRDDRGKFVNDDEALHPKVIGVRISKSRVEKFGRICERLGETPTGLAREIVHEFIDNFEER